MADRARLRFEQASIMLEQPAQEDAAAEILHEILTEDPSQHQAAILLSGILEKSGRYQELLDLLGAQLDSAKDREDVASILAVSVRMGSLHEQQGRPDEAFRLYQAAIEWDPKSRVALEASVRLAEKNGDAYVLADSLEALLRVAEGEEAVQIAARLVSLRVEQRDPEAAERALELGFAACPSNAMLRDGLMVRYRKRNDFAKIASVLERASLGTAEDPALVRQLVDAHRAAGQPEQALIALEGLLASEPDREEWRRERAALLIELGRDEQAIVDLERAYQRSPSYRGDLIEVLDRAIARAEPPRDRELKLRLLEILEQTGDAEGVHQRLSELVKADPKDKEALAKLGALEARTENWVQASTAYRRLIALEEGEALVEVALKLADACERAERFGDARGGLERALKAAPGHVGIRERLKHLYEVTGEGRELAKLLEEDAAREPDVAQCLASLLAAGELWLGPDGDASEAVRVLEQAHKLSSESLEGIALLARAWAAQGRREEAMRMLEETAKAHRGQRGRPLAYVHREIATLELETGHLRDAIEWMNKALELDLRNGLLAMQLGELAMDAEDYDTASRAFRTVAMMKSLDPESQEGAASDQKADANYYLAWLAYREGDVRKAKVFATKAVTRNPKHEQALALLAQIDAR
jgi:tetratricopeptide (TPR) repeat protein